MASPPRIKVWRVGTLAGSTTRANEGVNRVMVTPISSMAAAMRPLVRSSSRGTQTVPPVMSVVRISTRQASKV